jgi:hypothetical protein
MQAMYHLTVVPVSLLVIMSEFYGNSKDKVYNVTKRLILSS